jgi:FkbM family methyltransferase
MSRVWHCQNPWTLAIQRQQGWHPVDVGLSLFEWKRFLVTLRSWVFREVLSVRGHHFVARGFVPGSVVLDLGAHSGEFSHELIARWNCRCVAVEANPRLCRRIGVDSQLMVINAAIDSDSGKRDFFIHPNPEASSLYHVGDVSPGAGVESVRTLSLADLYCEVGIERAALVKMDVEGAEVAILNDVPDSLLQRCDQITVEFHDSCISAISSADVEHVIRRVQASGFFAFSFSGTYTDVLFVRRDAGLLTAWEAFFIRNVLRYVFALQRRLQGKGAAVGSSLHDSCASRHEPE